MRNSAHDHARGRAEMSSLLFMAVIVAAVVSMAGWVAVELLRRAAENRRAAAAAGEARGAAYEAFISEALDAIGVVQRLTSVEPRFRFLPLNRYARESLKSAERALAAVGRTHTRVRRLAPDDVAEASDAVLEVVARAGDLLSGRQRDAAIWDALWSDARDARIEFERRTRPGYHGNSTSVLQLAVHSAVISSPEL